MLRANAGNSGNSFLQGRALKYRRALILLAVASSCRDARPISIFGEWVVTEYRAPGRSSMTQAEAERFRGLRLSYSPGRATLLDRSCDRPAYQRWTLSPRHFESDYGVPPRQVGVPGDSIEVIRVDCGTKGESAGGEIVILSADRLIFTTGGVFFLLSRVAT